MRLEAAERLRSQAHESAIGATGVSATQLAITAAGDDAARQVAWSSFVPFLAHPVMATGARNAMSLIETARDLPGPASR